MTIIEAPRSAAAGEDVEGDAGGGRPAEADPATADGGPVLGFAPAGLVQGSDDAPGVDPAYVVEAAVAVPTPAEPPAVEEVASAPEDAGEPTDAAYLVDDTGPDGPPVDTAPPGSLAAAVADHLAGLPPAQDGRSESAQAVLDVLRASGWSDTTETLALKAEVDRLRELLDMVVRDHRARVALDANGDAAQAYWLVPLLRAAHGVSFGTLGAKVHLRTAMHDVPPDVLASAGLRIDDSGPIPDPEHDRDYR